MSENVVVKESLIQGKGVFATKDFKKGEKIHTWNVLAILTRKQFDELPEEEKRYVSSFKEGEYLLFGPPDRYINHSCDANTVAEKDGDFAIRDIKEGEEITCDYIKENVPGLNMVCNCGSTNCKGRIKTA